MVNLNEFNIYFEEKNRNVLNFDNKNDKKKSYCLYKYGALCNG